MSLVKLLAAFVVLFASAALVSFVLEIRRRARHLRKHPEWKPGERLR